MTVTKQVFFDGFYNFLLFMSAQVLRSAQHLPKTWFHGNCHGTTPRLAKYIIKVAFER